MSIAEYFMILYFDILPRMNMNHYYFWFCIECVYINPTFYIASSFIISCSFNPRKFKADACTLLYVFIKLFDWCEELLEYLNCKDISIYSRLSWPLGKLTSIVHTTRAVSWSLQVHQKWCGRRWWWGGWEPRCMACPLHSMA